MAQFMVAALEGAVLMSKVTKEIGVMEDCVAQLKAHLGLYRVSQPVSVSHIHLPIKKEER